MSKWDQRFLELAGHVAQWSKDESSKVGCVLVDARNRIISLGFNGPPSGTADIPRDRPSRLRRAIHAEANALHFANRSVEGCTAYVTHPPCSHCTGHLVQRGVARIVFMKGTPEFEERWAEDIEESRQMCNESGVTLHAIG